MPAAPSPIPSPSAILGLTPRTNGRCDVLIIFLSSSISIYWFSACVDIDKAIEETSNGRHEVGTEYSEYEPTVTIPFNSESLNFVSYRACFKTLLWLRVENIALLPKVNIINIVPLDKIDTLCCVGLKIMPTELNITDKIWNLWWLRYEKLEHFKVYVSSGNN